MHYLYIIYSEKIDKHYIGETPDVENRLIQHNTHYFKTNFSKSANDWKLLLKYPCENRKESLFLERFLKRMKSRKFLQKVIAYPEISSDILNKKNPGSPEISGLEAPPLKPRIHHRICGFCFFILSIEVFA